MGLINQIFGFVYIPFLASILVIFAGNCGRKMIQPIVLGFVNFKMYNWRVYPLLILFSMCVIAKNLFQIRSLHQSSCKYANNNTFQCNFTPDAQSQFTAELNRHYRDMMINACSVMLLFQVYVVCAWYEPYRKIRNEADKIKKDAGI